MGNIQPEITRIAGAKTTLGDYLKANGVAVAAGEKIDVLAGKLSDISSLTLESLSITTPPTQTEYTAGDSFNPAGMVVAANFSNGASLSITNYTCSPVTLAAGDTAVTVSLTFGSDTKSVQQPVTVIEAKSIAYTGAYSTKTITSNDVEYTLYTITGSGTLTVQGRYENVSLWLCGGGSGGNGGSYSGGTGGGGAYCAQYDAQTLSGSYTIAVGGATGNTSISLNGSALFSANGTSGMSGGTGGGGCGNYNDGGTGDSVAKYPFADSTNFYCHCAGGGGSSGNWVTRYDPDNYTTYGRAWNGGNGGSNGGSGGKGSSPTVYSSSTASGGNRGGGAGGDKKNGGAATFYGSGGGGGGADGRDNYSYPYDGINTSYAGGAGYQGVVYIRVPVERTPSQQYKYYRLNLTSFMRASSATTAFYNLAELTLYNGSSAVSYSGAAFTASSSYSGYPVANAFDGKTSTMWHTENVTSAWIQVELSAAASITHFSITPRSDGTYDRPDALSLVASNDGSSWTTLYSGSGLGASWAQSTTKNFNLD